jgi:hypothetical protein
LDNQIETQKAPVAEFEIVVIMDSADTSRGSQPLGRPSRRERARVSEAPVSVENDENDDPDDCYEDVDDLHRAPDSPESSDPASGYTPLEVRAALESLEQVRGGGSKKKKTKNFQWEVSGNSYFAMGESVKTVPPGVYEIEHSQSRGFYLSGIDAKTDGLIHFPDTPSEAVTQEIEKFWDREHLFRKFELAFKRGILLYGPPGSGKSCTLQMVTQAVIKRGGIVIKFGSPSYFVGGMRIFREVQPNTPVVCLMEDLDSTLDEYSETDVLNILDGIDRVDNVVFIATTNFPERLGERVSDRPSRFDKRYFVGHPKAASRRIYFSHLFKHDDNISVDLDQWVKDSKGFSLAHLKELFTNTIILDTPYDVAVSTLRDMKKQAKGSAKNDTLGFRVSNDDED